MVIWQCNACARGQILRGAAPRRSGAVQKWRKATRRALLLWCSQACHELYSQGNNTSRGRAYERASARPGGKGGSAFAPLLEHAVDVRVLCRLRARWRRFDLGGLRRQRARRGRELLRAPAHRPKGEQHRAEGAVHSPSPSAVEASSSPSSCLLRDRRERRRGSGRGRRRGDRHARRPRRLRGLSRRRGNPHARRHRNRAQGAPGGVGAADGAADVANVEATTESTEAAAIAALSRRCCSRVGRVEAALSRRESDDLVRELVGRDRRVENAGHGARRTRWS